MDLSVEEQLENITWWPVNKTTWEGIRDGEDNKFVWRETYEGIRLFIIDRYGKVLAKRWIDAYAMRLYYFVNLDWWTSMTDNNFPDPIWDEWEEEHYIKLIMDPRVQLGHVIAVDDMPDLVWIIPETGEPVAQRKRDGRRLANTVAAFRLLVK